ncbi:hypothetical protein BDA99DRAFT_560836 [Phascolomyces articulosus]|uniref:Tyr recombinase domain-containing protein n=1 Tax=Phascolomyces articulosus TaxID=60185 RepID=A0AAD5KAV3_9FUNG|nr:hypothetical protein BDA99DRAFT_560836 [Phascolomyces articulosus]
MEETKGFMKGLGKKKPKPKKDKFKRWDFSQLVDYLATLTPWSNLTTKRGWRPASDFARTMDSVHFVSNPSNKHWPVEMVLTAVDVKEDTARYRLSSTDKRFISSIPPHVNINGGRLRIWFQLAMAGANTSNDHAVHSVRAEATTAALELGANIDDILASGYWSRRSTFEKFNHLRPSSKPQ